MKRLSPAGEMLAKIGQKGPRERPRTTEELRAETEANARVWRTAHPEVWLAPHLT